MDHTLETERLTLRPFAPDDAADVQKLAGNPNVAFMIARVPHPYPDGLAAEWIAGHAAERASGGAYTFAIEHEGQLIGTIGLTRGTQGYALGYWLGEPWWGQGFATEAACRVVRFAFEVLELPSLLASYRVDNAASGSVLAKCGFQYTGDGMQWSAALGKELPVRRVALSRERFEAISGPK